MFVWCAQKSLPTNVHCLRRSLPATLIGQSSICCRHLIASDAQTKPFGCIVVPQECDDTNHLRIRIGSSKERSWILLPWAAGPRRERCLSLLGPGAGEDGALCIVGIRVGPESAAFTCVDVDAAIDILWRYDAGRGPWVG
jgi:hypothetical protein